MLHVTAFLCSHIRLTAVCYFVQCFATSDLRIAKSQIRDICIIVIFFALRDSGWFQTLVINMVNRQLWSAIWQIADQRYFHYWTIRSVSYWFSIMTDGRPDGSTPWAWYSASSDLRFGKSQSRDISTIERFTAYRRFAVVRIYEGLIVAWFSTNCKR